jgi:PhoH-like ATPase
VREAQRIIQAFKGKTMIKNFILDTNVLLHDPNAIFGFEDNNVCIPIYVIEEIDNFKKDLSDLGQNARQVSRLIDSYRVKGNLRDGMTINGGGKLRVLFIDKENSRDLAQSYHQEFSLSHQMDRLILASALDIKRKEPKIPAVFVTKDTNLRIRADALGLQAVDYDRERKDISEIYTGVGEIFITEQMINQFYEKGVIELPDGMFHENMYAHLKVENNNSKSALGRVNVAERKIVPLLNIKGSVWGIRAKNKEQHFALDALLNDDVKLVTLIGKAGTGKTLLAIAAGLYKVSDEKIFTKCLVSRPIFPMGRDLGYLPGDIEEKLNPWMQPIYDNVEFLLNLSKKDTKASSKCDELIDLGLLEIEPLTYIRGRSIPNQYIIVDEAQNLTPHEVKTILTRVGHGTKMVLTGDIYQIDNPYVDSVNNGLAYVAEKFKDEKLSAHINLVKGERSNLAELAANRL